ncbi:hypothetical protein QVD17_16255 [Tagetes erecta]|uniref:Receptor-like serine/threonine-protein kinase n=1 Tax=Tagetes erecta TaxID=13708 RepID=A0AAD8KR50_TARER|nr:hypothetical protein QVD17_16255 [Tagetes erecta]
MERAVVFLLLFSLLFFHKNHTAELDVVSDSRFLTEGDTLVSETGVFELGFFRPDNTKNIYLGIWYKKIPVKTVIWVANGDRPLPDASPLLLKIVDPGVLTLFNNMSTIWSSNTSTISRNATAKLHDTGNLVLMDLNKKIIWQSFDFLIDTFVPGMKIGRNLLTGTEWHLTSWKSSQDPAPGDITMRAHMLGYPDSKLTQGDMVRYRGDPWSNLQFTGISAYNSSLSFRYMIVINESEMSFSYSLDDSSIISRICVNSSGQIESWVWVDNSRKWQLSLSLPRDMCDVYNTCNAYASCSLDMIQQSCACLDEKRFIPKNEKSWGRGDWSGGCVRRTPLECKNGSVGFIKYSNLKLPDTEHTWFNMSMSLDECEAQCLKNCTCMAYANPDTSLKGRGCVLWFNDLLDMRATTQGNGGKEIFVKMASSELDVQSTSKKKGGAHIKIILPLIVSGVLLIGISSTCLLYAQRKRSNIHARGESLNASQNNEEAIHLTMFSFSTIATATENFSTKNILGEGGFGPVYKGVLEEGRQIAVKRLSKTSSQGVDEFKNEVIFITKLQHRNLVKLLGSCIRGDEKLLIYEYMPNKSLDSFIFAKTESMLLDWATRFNIIKGITHGLLYLHRDSRLRIIHRDLKASNILVDQDMNPKISDFGLARSFGGNETHANTRRVAGTYGYMAPEYALDGRFSLKTDVFSFGVLVLEIVTGKKNRGFTHPEHANNLIGHAWDVYNEGRSLDLIDASIASSFNPPEVLRSIQVGLLCVQQNARDRPNMSSMVLMLNGEGALPQPKQPAFYINSEPLVVESSSGIHPGGSINGITISEIGGR